MQTFKLDETNSAIITTNDNGLATLETLSYPQSISQLVKLRLLVAKLGREYEPSEAIDWFAFIDNPDLEAVLATAISDLILLTDYVTQVDLSEAMYELTPNPRFTKICYTLGCGTKLQTNL